MKFVQKTALTLGLTFSILPIVQANSPAEIIRNLNNIEELTSKILEDASRERINRNKCLGRNSNLTDLLIETSNSSNMYSNILSKSAGLRQSIRHLKDLGHTNEGQEVAPLLTILNSLDDLYQIQQNVQYDISVFRLTYRVLCLDNQRRTSVNGLPATQAMYRELVKLKHSAIATRKKLE